MENTIYYTFSTIAQVLAVIVAITGAFAMFRFQSIKDSLLGMATDFLDASRLEILIRPLWLRLQTAIEYRKLEDIEPSMNEVL
ncbi:MAG: hypothetical protein ABSE72_08660 [Bacteroidales bacterium]|jgi:hypothetical protein